MFEFLKKKKVSPETSPELYALNFLNETLGGIGKIEENSLVIREKQLRFTVGFEGLEGKNGRFASHMAVWTDYPLMPSPVYEMCSGLGASKAGAIEESVKSFVFAAYSCWDKVTEQQWCTEFTTIVQGQMRKWQMCGSGKALMGGEQPDIDQDACLWQVVREEAEKYLGALKCYWIKLYIGKNTEMNVSEVRINDIRVESLSKILQKYADGLPIRGNGYYSEKQFFFIKQDEDTYEPYPYSKADLEEKVRQVLLLKWDCSQEEDGQERYYQEMEQICGSDGMLWTELDCFIREMSAVYACQEEIHFDHEIFAFRDDKRQEVYYATQFTAYDWVYSRMVALFRSGELTKELFSILLAESAIGQMIYKGQQEGKPVTSVSGFGIFDDDHTLKVR